MERIYIWLKTKWLKFKLRKARAFMEANCIARISQGQTSCVGENAVSDWCEIQNCISDTITYSLSSTASSLHQKEDKQAE